ncbi:MAG: hypothetical protein AB7K52_02595 [Phycisphaerales bacterium]
MSQAQAFSPSEGPARDAQTEPVSKRIARFITHATVVGLAISLVIHLSFLAVAGVWHLGGGGGGRSGGLNGPVEMAVMTEAELGALAEADLENASPGVEDMAPSDAPGQDLIDVPGGSGLPDAGELGSVGSSLGGAGSGTGIGVGTGEGGAGGGGAKFFGVEARGSRFIFIVDVSGSMEGRKIVTLRHELTTSIDGLAENALFLVYFFESQTIPIGNREKWIEATTANKNWAITQVGRVEARGGTEPGGAFANAFSLRPKADAIYFMTDGLFDAAVADRVAAMNRSGRKIPIHCIAFEERGSEALMRRIAEDSGGTYSYVEGPKR